MPGYFRSAVPGGDVDCGDHAASFSPLVSNGFLFLQWR